MKDQVVDHVVEEFGKICDAFTEIRREILNSQKYAAKPGATDKFYEAIRQFAHEIGLTPPFIPVYPDDDR